MDETMLKVSDELLHEWIGMRRHFMEFYNKKGLISCEVEGIHMNSEYFVDTFPEYKTVKRNSEEYPEQLEVWWDGMKFYCLPESVK